MLILVAGMLIISQIMLTSLPLARLSMQIVVGWMVIVSVSMLIVVQCMPSPLPRLSTQIVKVCMLFAVQSMLWPLHLSMLIRVHCMLIIGACMLWPLPLPWMSQRTLGRHPHRSFQLKKKRYELLGQPAEIEKLTLTSKHPSSLTIVSLMMVNFRVCQPQPQTDSNISQDILIMQDINIAQGILINNAGYHLTGSNSTSSKV